MVSLIINHFLVNQFRYSEIYYATAKIVLTWGPGINPPVNRKKSWKSLH